MLPESEMYAQYDGSTEATQKFPHIITKPGITRGQ